ncbi:hypothetical protein BGX34_007229, partial [Mortierella sp. NVP85]
MAPPAPPPTPIAAPAASRPPLVKAKSFESARSEFLVGNMKKPLPYEVENFKDMLVQLIAQHGASFELLNTDTFKGIYGINPLYTVPCTDALQSHMEQSVADMKFRIKSYLYRNIQHGAITADSWTSVDQRKFFGIKFHFITPGYEMASIIIGKDGRFPDVWDITQNN